MQARQEKTTRQGVDHIFSHPKDLKPLDVAGVVGQGAASRRTSVAPNKGLTSFFRKGSVKRTLADGEAKCENYVMEKMQKGHAGVEKHIHPVQEMQFYNIGGARVYTYTGLEAVRSNEQIFQAGPRVRETAVGVLMLDKYAIQERPGDCANPFTFWPYQAIYVVPQGVTFALCKNVGSSGPNAAQEYPLEVSAICQALMALAEVAARLGFKRLMITADCGFYAPATPVYAKQLTCWGEKSWIPHPDGAFAAFNVPRFLWPAPQLEITLALGTMQLISTSDPKHSLAAQMTDASVVYITADLRGLYGRPFLNDGTEDNLKADEKTALEKEYDRLLQSDGEFKFSPIDCVVRANDALFAGGLTADDVTDKTSNSLRNVVERLVEFNAGSTSYLVGMFLGKLAVDAQRKGGKTHIPAMQYVWESVDDPDQRKIVETMTSDPEKCGFVGYLKALLLQFTNACCLERRADIKRKLTEEEEWRALIAIVGNEDNTKTYAELVDAVTRRAKYVAKSLLSIGKVFGDISGSPGLPLGAKYIEGYAHFNLHVNSNLLSKNVKRSHAIDGRNIAIVDARYIPGFGLQVGEGLTVWTSVKNYLFMSAILLRFCELLQAQGVGPSMICMECTELFTFTSFLEELGVPVLDNINLLSIASKCTTSPLRWVTFTQNNMMPPTPAALICDPNAATYRDPNLAVRTPTDCAKEYMAQRDLFTSLLQEQQKRWAEVKHVQPWHGGTKLSWKYQDYLRSKPGETLYMASTQLDCESYVPPGATRPAPPNPTGKVQFGPRQDKELVKHDLSTFFGEDGGL